MISSEHYCIGCAWATSHGDFIYCPFVYGSCARIPETLIEPDYERVKIRKIVRSKPFIIPDLASRKPDFPKMYEYNGQMHSLSDWSEILGIELKTLRNRISMGWSIERAIDCGLRLRDKKGKNID